MPVTFFPVVDLHYGGCLPVGYWRTAPIQPAIYDRVFALTGGCDLFYFAVVDLPHRLFGRCYRYDFGWSDLIYRVALYGYICCG